MFFFSKRVHISRAKYIFCLDSEETQCHSGSKKPWVVMKNNHAAEQVDVTRRPGEEEAMDIDDTMQGYVPIGDVGPSTSPAKVSPK